ncbi:MAG: MBL fold metallo-hydrolase [Candidatus Woesebacteria bacterium]|jgi:competence protein ComEC
MQANLKKIIFIFLCLVLSLLYFVFKQWPDQYTHIVFCDVGQGDAILLYHGFWQMLIDGGPNDQVLSCLDNYMPFWDRTIELVVATHADQDHIAGLTDVLKNYQVKFLFLNDFRDTEEFSSFKEAVLNELALGLDLKKPILGEKILLPHGLELTVLLAEEQKITNFLSPNKNLSELYLSDNLDEDADLAIDHNNGSIVLLLEIDEIKALFTGDIETSAEQALIARGLVSKTNILKVGHHGSKTSSSEKFLKLVSPEISVISCGKFNKFGHPSSETLAKLRKLKTKILRTDQLGDIELLTDGQKIYLADLE